MASRFEQVDDEVIEELKEKSENENTKKSTEHWKNVFVKWANERKQKQNLKITKLKPLTTRYRNFMPSCERKMEMTTSRNH